MDGWPAIITAISGLVVGTLGAWGILSGRRAKADALRIKAEMMRDSAEAIRKSDSDKRRDALNKSVDDRVEVLLDQNQHIIEQKDQQLVEAQKAFNRLQKEAEIGRDALITLQNETLKRIIEAKDAENNCEKRLAAVEATANADRINCARETERLEELICELKRELRLPEGGD